MEVRSQLFAVKFKSLPIYNWRDSLGQTKTEFNE